jgi:SHS2 domain-containing protein
VRLALPQPFEDLDHTADVGVRVRGASAEEALARLALAMGALLAGGGAAVPDRAERVIVEGGPGLAGTAVGLLRELLFRFATRRRIPAAIEIVRAGEDGAEAVVETAPYDPDVHGEGVDLKAVTWHAARLERDGEGDGAGWIGQVVFDI